MQTIVQPDSSTLDSTTHVLWLANKNSVTSWEVVVHKSIWILCL